MRIGEISKLEDTFSYKSKDWFNDQKYIISVRDIKKDRQIIPIVFVDNNKLVDLDEDEFNNKIWTTTNFNKEDKPLTRFFDNQLIAINYGNLTENNNEKEWLPKIRTYNENIDLIESNKLIEIIEGEIIEEDSLFKPVLSDMFKLIKDFYIDSEQSFFVLSNNNLYGPFKAIKVFDDFRFKISKSSLDIRFGEYDFDNNSYLEFEANEINRKIYINNCTDLHLTFKKEYDFISDDDLLEKFSSELKNYPEYFNENNLKNVLTILKKATEVDKIENKIKSNFRLKSILTKGEKILDRDIDLLKNIPEIKELKENKQKIEEELFNSKKDIEEIEIRKSYLINEIQELEQKKTEELEKRKKDLDNEIEELENRKNNLEKEVEDNKLNLEIRLKEIKKEIDDQRVIEDYLKAGVKKLQDEFTSEQKDAQYKLAELVKGKTHFDFISGRDLSGQENESFNFLDFQTVDQFNQNQYRDFRTELVNILKQKNRNFDNHFVDNLLISIYQNTLTVFAGKPGTGKTTLARYLTNILAPEDKIREVSVNRGWTSQKDFIGFVNPLTKKFHQSSTNTYTLLKQMDYETEKDIYLKTPMAFIILDEANLSPLEHYWSSFYNLTDSSGKLKIQLGHKEEVSFFDNLRFIGTINYDHTTEELSPRVLDRINIIQLPKNDDDNFNFSNSEIKRIQLTYERCKNFFEVDNKISESTKTEKTDKIINQYKEIRDEFKKLKINISPRVGQAIKKYIVVASEYMSDVNKPLDYCVAQRLLPLINLQGLENRQKLDLLKEKLENNKCDISATILGDIINIGSEKGIYEENFNYFLTLSNV